MEGSIKRLREKNIEKGEGVMEREGGYGKGRMKTIFYKGNFFVKDEILYSSVLEMIFSLLP